jgi:hypothetical protein
MTRTQRDKERRARLTAETNEAFAKLGIKVDSSAELRSAAIRTITSFNASEEGYYNAIKLL